MSRKSTYNKSSLNYYKVVFVKCKSNLAPDIFLTFSKSTPPLPFQGSQTLAKYREPSGKSPQPTPSPSSPTRPDGPPHTLVSWTVSPSSGF